MLDIYEKGMAEISEAGDRYPWDNKDAYAWYLAQSYYYLIHSTRLLGAGAARFSAEEEGLHRRYLDHAREEKGHHLLALKDLENLGYDIKDFREMPYTKLMYEPQYYKIEHMDPCSLFGYIFALEGISARKAGQICNLVESYYGRTVANFLRVHNQFDPDHLEKAFHWVGTLDEKRRQIVRDAFEQTCMTYIDFLDKTAKMALAGRKTVAA
mgnify:CR=1 FL=1